MRGGELVLVSTVQDLRSLAGRRVRASFAEPVASPPAWPDGCDVIALSPTLWDLRVRGPLGPIVARLAALPVADLDVQMPHLEEILKTFYADSPAP